MTSSHRYGWLRQWLVASGRSRSRGCKINAASAHRLSASPRASAASTIFSWCVASGGEAVGEKGEAAHHHEAVEHQRADGGRQGAVVPGEEDVAEVAVGDGGGAEGDGAGAAVAGEAPEESSW